MLRGGGLQDGRLTSERSNGFEQACCRRCPSSPHLTSQQLSASPSDMRIVTWNINGLGSLRFPFHIHAARSHAYPAAARGDGSGAAGSSPRELPADDFDYDDTALTDTPTPQTVDTSATASADAAATTAAAAGLSPHSPAFPAFPFERRPLTPQLVHSHDELVEYFQADIVCFQEVKLGRARMDLLAKAVRARAQHSTARHSTACEDVYHTAQLKGDVRFTSTTIYTPHRRAVRATATVTDAFA